jgi:type IV secretory pathway TrbL component
MSRFLILLLYSSCQIYIYISFTQAIHILISNISNIYIFLNKNPYTSSSNTHTHSLIYTHTHLCLIFSFICVDSFLSLESSLTLLFSFALVPFFFYSTAGYTHREKERDTRDLTHWRFSKEEGKTWGFLLV